MRCSDGCARWTLGGQRVGGVPHIVGSKVYRVCDRGGGDRGCGAGITDSDSLDTGSTDTTKNISVTGTIAMISPLGTAILAVLLVALAICQTKPSFMYNDKGKPKNFGTGPEQTCVPIWVVLVGVGLAAYAAVN